MDDFLSTTAVVVWARNKITPKVLWSAIGALVTTLVVCVTWIVNYQSDMRQFREALAEDKKSYADMQHRLDILQDIKTALAVTNSKLDDLEAEVTRQGRKWDRVEEVADSPPHARRRR